MRLLDSKGCQYAALCLLAGLLVLYVWFNPPRLVPDEPRPLSAIAAQSKQLDEMRRARDAFVDYFDKVMEETARQGLRLSTVVDRIHAYCEKEYPAYLYHLIRIGKGTTLHEKIAWNIVAHIQGELEQGNDRGWPEDTIQRLMTDYPLMSLRDVSANRYTQAMEITAMTMIKAASGQ
jgi:hypothetical protein